MSNTRKAESGTPLRQERWASSEEFEPGLLGNLVARRCSTISNREDRQLVYALQKLSHLEGGLGKVATDLCTQFRARIGTASMVKFGMRKGQVYNAEQVRAIRGDIPRTVDNAAANWPLRGETTPAETLDCILGRESKSGAGVHPDRYPAEQFVEYCREYCATYIFGYLTEACLNPGHDFPERSPWYFSSLIESLREYLAALTETRSRGRVVTEVGQIVRDALDYAYEGKCLTIVDGSARIGKTFEAKAWCDERPGIARYVQVPSTNDDVGFFRAIARALGVSCGRGWKAVQLRQRIEDTLQGGDLVLVFDEGHYLWPVSDCRHSLPGRINWVMTALVNYGVPVCIITTPQFIEAQKAVEKRTRWTSEQFIGRIGQYYPLPKSLSESDLSKVAKVLLPEGDAKAVEILVRYAQGSAKYLAGIESAVRRARYLAKKEGRDKASRDDIKRAIKEGVIPSDSALASALETPAKNVRKQNKRAFMAPLMPAEAPFKPGGDEDTEAPERAGRGMPQEALGSNRISGVGRLETARPAPGLVAA